jgi:hypothetical protein
MSEATVKALTDAIYDALEGSDPVRELDNEQVYEVARLATQIIEATEIRIPRQERIGVWCDQFESFFSLSPAPHRACCKPVWRDLP